MIWEYQKQKYQACHTMDAVAANTFFARYSGTSCISVISTLWKPFAIGGKKSRMIFMWKNYLLALLLLLLDQSSKYLFVQSSFVGVMRYFHPLWNSGSAWGIPVPVWLSIVLWFWCLICVWRYSWKMKVESPNYTAKSSKQQVASSKLFSWCLALVFAGIIGNMIDRILYGAVRDFIRIGDWFPIFNLADVYLCVGVGMFIYYEMKWQKSWT